MKSSFIKEDTVLATKPTSSHIVYVYVCPILGWQGGSSYGVRVAYALKGLKLTHHTQDTFTCLFEALNYCQALSDANEWENMSWADTAKTSDQVELWYQNTELLGV